MVASISPRRINKSALTAQLVKLHPLVQKRHIPHAIIVFLEGILTKLDRVGTVPIAEMACSKTRWVKLLARNALQVSMQPKPIEIIIAPAMKSVTPSAIIAAKAIVIVQAAQGVIHAVQVGSTPKMVACAIVVARASTQRPQHKIVFHVQSVSTAVVLALALVVIVLQAAPHLLKL